VPDEREARIIEDAVANLRRHAKPETEKPASAWVLVGANLVALAGVLLWGWDAFALIALFWMENVVIGVFFVLRMLCADPDDVAKWLGKLVAVPFFCVHYGVFTLIHGVLVFTVLGRRAFEGHPLNLVEQGARAAADYGLWLPLAVLAASHLFSFCWNYLYGGEFRRATLKDLMTQPYGRVMVLHFAIIVGGAGTMALGSPLWALVVLLALKIALDLKAHLKEHSRPVA
jgi:hypothetical protein